MDSVCQHRALCRNILFAPDTRLIAQVAAARSGVFSEYYHSEAEELESAKTRIERQLERASRQLHERATVYDNALRHKSDYMHHPADRERFATIRARFKEALSSVNALTTQLQTIDSQGTVRNEINTFFRHSGFPTYH